MSFLNEILGDDGAEALEKATKRAPMLRAVIVPRTVLSWISTVGKLGYEGELPGTPDSFFSLIKSGEETFTGALTIKNKVYTFEDAELLHVAASVGVALDIQVDPIDERLKTRDLTDLGKSIDLLVKSQIIKDFKKRKLKKDQEEKVDAPAKAAEPNGPKVPEIAQQPIKQVSSTGLPVNKPNMAVGQGQKLKITKAESEKVCVECGGTQFKTEKFVGCVCFMALKPNVKVEKFEGDYLLKFKDLDEDAISTLTEFFKD